MNPMQPLPKAARSGRRIAGRAQQDHILDPYQAQRKLHEPTAFLALSPGIVLIARLIEQAIQKRKRAVDFMRGGEEYKYRLGARDTWIHHVSVER